MVRCLLELGKCSTWTSRKGFSCTSSPSSPTSPTTVDYSSRPTNPLSVSCNRRQEQHFILFFPSVLLALSCFSWLPFPWSKGCSDLWFLEFPVNNYHNRNHNNNNNNQTDQNNQNIGVDDRYRYRQPVYLSHLLTYHECLNL